MDRDVFLLSILQTGEIVMDSQLFIKCRRIEKALWVRASYPGKLSVWIRNTLNREAKKELPPEELDRIHSTKHQAPRPPVEPPDNIGNR